MESCRIIQGGFHNQTLRLWQSRTSQINPDCLIYPVFVSNKTPDTMDEIKTLPGQYRVGRDRLVEYLKPAIANGLKAILLFGCDLNKISKTDSLYDRAANPIYDALEIIKKAYPELTVACDLCLCAFTNNGHCFLVSEDNDCYDHQATLKELSKMAVFYAKHGADIIAPSDMNDGRVQAIHNLLVENGIRRKVSIMSYSSKFATCFYGPFRDACDSAPSGDRKQYQLPPGSSGLAVRTSSRDVDENADILMVKPIMTYLDVVKEIKTKHPEFPVAAYHVSGECAMLHHASEKGVFDLKTAVYEVFQCMHRSGVDVIISYFTPDVLKWLKEDAENATRRCEEQANRALVLTPQ